MKIRLCSLILLASAMTMHGKNSIADEKIAQLEKFMKKDENSCQNVPELPGAELDIVTEILNIIEKCVGKCTALQMYNDALAETSNK